MACQWERLAELAREHTVEGEWVRGHHGHPENERANRRAVRGTKEAAAMAQVEQTPELLPYHPSDLFNVRDETQIHATTRVRETCHQCRAAR
ncbi:RNase H family protein [Nocardia sp. XZ_19_369]|uniref:RNase H family protein n=1 Tax=Nocardia sp. XZ_19_369 TaxID=2769487 RepID=UPI0035A396A4